MWRFQRDLATLQAKLDNCQRPPWRVDPAAPESWARTGGRLRPVLCAGSAGRKFAYQALLLEEFALAGTRVEFVKGPRGGSASGRNRYVYDTPITWLRKAIAQRTAISCDRDRPGEHPVCQWPPFPRGCGTTMSSTPSSRRRTTPCFVCMESDGIVGNFNARQQTSHARTLRNRRESQRFSAGYVGPNCVWRAREAESIGKRSGIDRERRLQ